MLSYRTERTGESSSFLSVMYVGIQKISPVLSTYVLLMWAVLGGRCLDPGLSGRVINNTHSTLSLKRTVACCGFYEVNSGSVETRNYMLHSDIPCLLLGRRMNRVRNGIIDLTSTELRKGRHRQLCQHEHPQPLNKYRLPISDPLPLTFVSTTLTRPNSPYQLIEELLPTVSLLVIPPEEPNTGQL